MSNIEVADILPGDTIKAALVSDGILMERSGKVWSTSASGFRTEEDGYLWNSAWAGKYTFDLIDRPKPPLPTVLGTVIFARIVEGTQDTLVRRPACVDGWETLDGARWYTDEIVAAHSWRLAKVIPVVEA